MVLIILVLYVLIGAVYTNYYWTRYDDTINESIDRSASEQGVYEEGLLIIISLLTFIFVTLIWPYTAINMIIIDIRNRES